MPCQGARLALAMECQDHSDGALPLDAPSRPGILSSFSSSLAAYPAFFLLLKPLGRMWVLYSFSFPLCMPSLIHIDLSKFMTHLKTAYLVEHRISLTILLHGNIQNCLVESFVWSTASPQLLSMNP